MGDNENLKKYEYNKLTPFKWFILENFPFIEADFDAITNYQLYCKLVEYLNKTIEAMNKTGEAVEDFTQKFIDLQNYVDNYFKNLDVQEEINNKLDSMALDGSLTKLVAKYVDPFITAQNTSIDDIKKQLSAIASGSPIPVSSTGQMTDTSKTYVNTTDGNWYYYNGNSWIIGGVYQGTTVPDNSIDYNKLEDIIVRDTYEPFLTNDRKGFRSGSGNINNHIEGFLTVDSHTQLNYLDNLDILQNFSPKKIRCTYDFEDFSGNCGFYFSIPITDENKTKKLIFTAWINRTGIQEPYNLHSLNISEGTSYETVSITDTKKEERETKSYIKVLKSFNSYDLIKYVLDLNSFTVGNRLWIYIRPSTNAQFTGYTGYFDLIAPTWNILNEDLIGIEKIFDTVQEKFNWEFPNLIPAEDYANKKFLFLGDSITRLGWTDRGWIKYFDEILTSSLKIDVAVNGAKMCDQMENQVYDGNPVLENDQQNVLGNQVEVVKNKKNSGDSDYQDFDFIIIAAGTNDNPYTLDTNYNNIDSQFTNSDGSYVDLENVDRRTFAGAMRYIYQTLQNLYPNAVIFFNTPTQTAVTASKWWTATKIYKINKIIKEICKRLSVKYIDTYKCGICGIYETENQEGRDLVDGIHPNVNGAKKIGYYNAKSFINQFYKL